MKPAISDYLTLGQAAKRIPGTPHTQSIWRWCRVGVKVRGGGRVKLQHHRFGGRIFTTEQWIKEWGEDVANADRQSQRQAEDEKGRLRIPSPAEARLALQAQGII